MVAGRIVRCNTNRKSKNQLENRGTILSNRHWEKNMFFNNVEKTVTDPKVIEEYVKKILEKSVYHSRDFSFRFITSRRPNTCHVTFEFPGKYFKLLSRQIQSEDGRDLEVDHAAVVLPDGNIIKRKSALDVEQQSELPDNLKYDSFFNYGAWNPI